MAVAWFRNPVLDESADVVDRDWSKDATLGVTKATRHPKYVFSTNKSACLMHLVAEMEIQHYALIAGGSKYGRLKQPAMIARSVCSYNFLLTNGRARTCTVPKADAVLCGACHGQPRPFRRGGKSTAEKVAARVKLGCEVAGYPSKLAREAGR